MQRSMLLSTLSLGLVPGRGLPALATVAAQRNI